MVSPSPAAPAPPSGTAATRTRKPGAAAATLRRGCREDIRAGGAAPSLPLAAAHLACGRSVGAPSAAEGRAGERQGPARPPHPAAGRGLGRSPSPGIRLCRPARPRPGQRRESGFGGSRSAPPARRRHQLSPETPVKR
ncbi:translation initiation factor IF-2-like [Aquila chrysaetos chrysaetos]|uniref:translation initiation factor IF-2-like n=1 Tax=Aquila chrysaetos chrysaetos TaxID=223781 RepID=UPI001176575B|nr:translation initiation factor IF-2-like [Aquila chrysaetos chrysaetos]